MYRLAPQLPSHGVVAPYTGGEILFGDGLTRLAVSSRYDGGARIITQRADGEAGTDGKAGTAHDLLSAGHDLLFLVRADGQLAAVTQSDTPVRWSEARGSAYQLLLNVIVLIVVGALMLRLQRIVWRVREERAGPRKARQPG